MARDDQTERSLAVCSILSLCFRMVGRMNALCTSSCELCLHWRSLRFVQTVPHTVDTLLQRRKLPTHCCESLFQPCVTLFPVCSRLSKYLSKFCSHLSHLCLCLCCYLFHACLLCPNFPQLGLIRTVCSFDSSCLSHYASMFSPCRSLQFR